MKFKLLFILLLLSVYAQAQNFNIIPQPKSVVAGVGQFTLNNHSTIGVNDASLLPIAAYFQKEVFKAKGLSLAVSKIDSACLIHLILTNGTDIAGAYKLKLGTDGITVNSSSKEGMFYGLITLIQIIKDQPVSNNIGLLSCEIKDEPRYQWRGLMLDEARHFFGKQKVKQLLDWMAYYKLNKFHWHLTDVQGWRIEIKKYPKLTSIGAIGNYSDTLAEAEFYTQEEIKDIVAYAAERFITVIPEIDMPGHATAANKAYPEYSGGSVAGFPDFTFNPVKDSTYQFLTDVVKETSALFPSKMMHLGGDEVFFGIKAWSLSPTIAGFMQKNNFADVTELEHYFFKRMADTVNSLGSKVLAWDEATGSNLAPDKTIIFWWRQNLIGQLHLALQKGYQVVLCPRLPLYFDFLQDTALVSGRNWLGVYNTVNDVYNFPDMQMQGNDDLQSKQIIGVQANLWTEKIESEKRLDFMLFPRIAGLAEAGWASPEVKNQLAFEDRLQAGFKNYDAAGIYYYNPFDPAFHPEAIDFAPVVKKVVKVEKHTGRRTGKHTKGSKKTSKKAHKKRK